MDKKPTPRETSRGPIGLGQDDSGKIRLKRRLYAAILSGVVTAALVIVLFQPWSRSRFTQDFWPPDRSFVGPNLVASVVQAIAVAFVVYALYPPIRKRIEASLERHKAEMMSHVSAETAKLHAMLSHIIKHHPDIPDYKEK